MGPGNIEKRRGPCESSLRLEAAGLEWLAEAEPAGGIRVARVTSATDDLLVEERVETGAPTRAAARRIGEALARTHAAGAPWLGCPPAGWPPEGGARICGHVGWTRPDPASSPRAGTLGLGRVLCGASNHVLRPPA